MPFTLLPENGFTKAVQTTVLPGLKPFHQSGAEETAVRLRKAPGEHPHLPRVYRERV